MRLIALSIVIFCGCFLAAAGTVAEALPGARRFNELDAWGLLLTGVGVVLFVLELIGKLPALPRDHNTPWGENVTATKSREDSEDQGEQTA